MNLTLEQRCERPNIAFTNAHIAFRKLQLIKSKDLHYLCDSILLKSLIEIVKEQVKETEFAHQGKYYAEDFCNTIDKLYNIKFEDKQTI